MISSIIYYYKLTKNKHKQTYTSTYLFEESDVSNSSKRESIDGRVGIFAVFVGTE